MSSLIEKNPVFIDQKLKFRKALCAAFAATACSSAMVGVLVSDETVKQQIAVIVTVWAAMAANPIMRREKIRAGMLPIRLASEPYGVNHPYQIESDRITTEMNIKAVTVYKSSHPKMAAMPIVTDYKNIYISPDFEEALHNEDQIEGIIGHELGHFKETSIGHTIVDVLANIRTANVIMSYGFALFAPVTTPIMFAAATGCFALHVVGKQTELYGARRREHLADLYGLSYAQDKWNFRQALKATNPAADRIMNTYIAQENEARAAKNKAPLKEYHSKGDDYKSTWSTHPNIPERLHVIDEAMRKGPV